MKGKESLLSKELICLSLSPRLASTFISCVCDNKVKSKEYNHSKWQTHPLLACRTNNTYQSPTVWQYKLLLQRNKLWGVSSTNTRAVMLHRLVSQRKLTQIVTNHLCLDFNIVETLSVVHTHHWSNHLRNNDHVTKMSFHCFRTLILRSLRLLPLTLYSHSYSNAQSLYQSLRLSLQTTTETTTSTSLLFTSQTQTLTSTSSIKSFEDMSKSLSKSTPR